MLQSSYPLHWWQLCTLLAFSHPTHPRPSQLGWGRVMQHSITLLIGQKALTQSGGVLGHCPVDKQMTVPLSKIYFNLFNTLLITRWFHVCYFVVLMSSLLFYNVENCKNCHDVALWGCISCFHPLSHSPHHKFSDITPGHKYLVETAMHY